MSRRSMSFSWPRIWLERNCRSVRSDSRWGIEEFPGQGIQAGTADRGLYFTALAGALAWPWRPALAVGVAGGLHPPYVGTAEIPRALVRSFHVRHRVERICRSLVRVAAMTVATLLRGGDRAVAIASAALPFALRPRQHG
ncbi:hypothetical protein FQZ97_1095880 [compost metagenome]